MTGLYSAHFHSGRIFDDNNIVHRTYGWSMDEWSMVVEKSSYEPKNLSLKKKKKKM